MASFTEEVWTWVRLTAHGRVRGPTGRQDRRRIPAGDPLHAEIPVANRDGRGGAAAASGPYDSATRGVRQAGTVETFARRARGPPVR
jgi:hypothetical protein